MSDFETMAARRLERLIGAPRCPLLIDCRLDEDFALDRRLLPTAFRLSHLRIEAEAPAFAARLASGQGAVTICQRGAKLSQGAAAILRACGMDAQALDGGFEAWVKAELPLFDPAPLADPDNATPSLWTTRQRPKVDRIACAWLILRFIDPNARVLFVPTGEVLAVAERFGAIPFDIEGARFSHHGDQCSFDAFCERFALATPALERLRPIVRGADTGRLDLAPECAGFLAASLGLSRSHGADLAQLEAGLALYDWFYRWARDGSGEAHAWASERRGGAG